MSAYTTIRITRSTARDKLIEHLTKTVVAVASASDKLLEDMLDQLLETKLYNCRIVADGAENDDALVK